METGHSTVTVDMVEKVFFNDDPTAAVLRKIVREKAFGRGLVPKNFLSDSRFGKSSAGIPPLTGDELKAVVLCLRQAAVDGRVPTVDSSCTNAALEFCNRQGWLHRNMSGEDEVFEVPSKLHLW